MDMKASGRAGLHPLSIHSTTTTNGSGPGRWGQRVSQATWASPDWLASRRGICLLCLSRGALRWVRPPQQQPRPRSHARHHLPRARPADWMAASLLSACRHLRCTRAPCSRQQMHDCIGMHDDISVRLMRRWLSWLPPLWVYAPWSAWCLWPRRRPRSVSPWSLALPPWAHPSSDLEVPHGTDAASTTLCSLPQTWAISAIAMIGWTIVAAPGTATAH